MHGSKLVINEETDIIIPQEVKEDYEYIKSVVENSDYSIDWNQALEILNRNIKQNFPEVPFLTEKYIDYLMYAACFYNKLKLVSWLIRNGASVNFQDPESGNTLLHLAALNGNVELAKLLIVNGVCLGYIHSDIKANLQGNTYLHLAAEKGYDEFIQFIISKIAQDSVGYDSGNDIVNYKNKEGNTLLHLAVQNSHVKCAEQLLDSYHDKNKKSNSVYIYYCCSCLKFIIIVFTLYNVALLFLFLKEVIVNSSSFSKMIENYGIQFLFLGGLVFLCAYICKHWRIKDDYSLSAITNNNKEIALHLAIKNLQEENDQDRYYQCTKLLIEKTPHFKINAQDQEGKTALHLATEKGLIKSVKLLLENKIDTKIVTNSKKIALHLAIENSHYDCARHIVEYMVKVESKERIWGSILHKFTKSKSTKLWKEKVLYLTIKHQPQNYNTALWYRKRELICELLKVTDESAINKAYSLVKGCIEKSVYKDSNNILMVFCNFFREHESYKGRKLAQLKRQELWGKDYTLYCSSLSLTILAILYLLKEIPFLGKENYFINCDYYFTFVAKIITVISFLLAVRSYLKHREVDKCSDYKDKIEEIEKLLIEKRKKGDCFGIEAQDDNFHELNDDNEYSYGTFSQPTLDCDKGEASLSQQRRKSSCIISKAEIFILKFKKIYSYNTLESAPLLTTRLIETRRSLPSESSKFEQIYKTTEELPPILEMKPIKQKCKKTSNEKLIKNPSFCKHDTSLANGRQ